MTNGQDSSIIFKLTENKEVIVLKKIDLITGFLGSGKTTFLKNYVRYLLDKGEKVCILENDFGAINVDMVLLQDLLCENCEIEMIIGGDGAEAHKRRFKTKLIAMGMKDYTRIIVEPSGIFDMDEFFDLMYESPIDRWYEIGSVLTILDATLPDVLSKQSEYLMATEAANSGKIIISKAQLVDEMKIESTIAHLRSSMEEFDCSRKLNDNSFLIKDWDELTEDDYRKLSNCGYVHSDYVKQSITEDFYRSLFYFNVSFDETELKEVLKKIFSDEKCGLVHRIKGFIKGGKAGWLEINATGERIELSDSEYGQDVIIVIGELLDDAVIRPYFGENTKVPECVS